MSWKRAPYQVYGRPIAFTRRRYGKTTFTWVHVGIGTTELAPGLVEIHWSEIGTPWECVTPPRKQVEEAVLAHLKDIGGGMPETTRANCEASTGC